MHEFARNSWRAFSGRGINAMQMPRRAARCRPRFRDRDAGFAQTWKAQLRRDIREIRMIGSRLPVNLRIVVNKSRNLMLSLDEKSRFRAVPGQLRDATEKRLRRR